MRRDRANSLVYGHPTTGLELGRSSKSTVPPVVTSHMTSS